MSAHVSRRSFLAASAGVATASVVRLPGSDIALAHQPFPSVQDETMVDNTDPAIVFTPAGNWPTWSNLGPKWYGGTARSTNIVGSSFEYTNISCTRLKWWSTTKPDRGLADVFIDGQLVATVDTRSAVLTPTKVVFDSGPLPSGAHTIKVLAKTGPWIECDALEVTKAVHETFTIDDIDPAIGYFGAWGAYAGVAGHVAGTAHSTSTKDASFYYGQANCSRIQWIGTKEPARGKADVFVDGVLVATVDLAGPVQQHQQVIFDTGTLAPGSHAISVVSRAELGSGSGTPWITIDALRVTADPTATFLIDGSDAGKVRASGKCRDQASNTIVSAWARTLVPGASFGTTLVSATQGSFAEVSFIGDAVQWMGSRGPDRGQAEVYVDGALVRTVDTYGAVAQLGQPIFEAHGLSTDRLHTLRIRVLRTRNSASSGYAVDIDSFRCAGAINAPAWLASTSLAEVATIRNRTKPAPQPASWQPVADRARVPEDGVALTGGPLKTCFDNNVRYLAYCWSLPNYVTGVTFWILNWPTSNEARMLMGAGHALRWSGMLDPADRDTLETVVDTLVANAKTRQAGRTATEPNNGFALRWNKPAAEPVHSATLAATDGQIAAAMNNAGVEMANYDRAMWTRGMVAAMKSGVSPDAGPVLRSMGDWFNRWYAAQPAPAPALIAYSLGAQGHIASTLTHLSPIGNDDDLVTAERYYVQEWWLTQLANREPLAISHYPLNRPHSYLLIGLESYMDHYRATGQQRYLDAVLGGWEMFRRDFMLIGGGTAITESGTLFPAQGADITRTNNEFDGAIFWIHLNQRLLQMFPDDERYATEIERCVYNIGLAQQDASGNHGIRYHGSSQQFKDPAQIINTCCEVNGTGLYGRLPEMLYSISDDGLYVNMWEASTIEWTQGSDALSLLTTTQFPNDGAVSHTITAAAPTPMKLHIRVPSWATTTMPISVNGAIVGTGSPGSYITLDRMWADGDVVNYVLPIGFRLTELRGLGEIDGVARYGLEYGPILMAFTGTAPAAAVQFNQFAVARFTTTPTSFLASLQPVSGRPLNFTVGGNPSRTFIPYYQVAGQYYWNYPVIQP